MKTSFFSFQFFLFSVFSFFPWFYTFSDSILNSNLRASLAKPLEKPLVNFKNPHQSDSSYKDNLKNSKILKGIPLKKEKRTKQSLLTLRIKPYVKIYSFDKIRLKAFIDEREMGERTSLIDFSFYDAFSRAKKDLQFSEAELISLWKSFKSSYFLNFPQVKRKKVFSAKEMKKYLEDFQKQWMKKNHWKNLMPFAQFILPQHLTVENKGFEISEDSIKTYLINQWSRQCGECEFIFSSLKLPFVRDFLRGRAWRISFPSKFPRGSFSLPLHFTSSYSVNRGSVNKGLKRRKLSPEDWKKRFESEKTYWIRGRLEVYKRVPVLNRDLKSAQKVGGGDFDFSFQKVNLFSERKLPLREEILGKKLRLGLKAGSILWKSVFLVEKAVKKGDLVKVKLDKGGWSVFLTGRAIQEGAVGDLVKVLNLSSNKIISALVVHRGEVLVQ